MENFENFEQGIITNNTPGVYVKYTDIRNPQKKKYNKEIYETQKPIPVVDLNFWLIGDDLPAALGGTLFD